MRATPEIPNWPEIWISLALGAVFAIALQDILKRNYQSLISSIQLRLERWRFGEIRSGEYFWCFGRQTNLFVIDGSSSLNYSPDSIRLKVVEAPDLNDSLANRRHSEIAKLNNGEADWWNGELFGLSSYSVGRNNDESQLAVTMSVYRHDYATFRASTCMLVNTALDDPDLREERKLIAQTPVGFPAVPLASGVGVFTVVVSGDGLVVSGKRSSYSGVRPNQRDFGICEAIHPVLDNVGSGIIDVFNTARRGVLEEITGDEINFEEIRLIGFAVDVPWQQFVLIAYAKLRESSHEIIRRRSRGAAGKWELESIRFDPPERLFRAMGSEPTWDMGILANYMVSAQLFGRQTAKRLIGAG